MYKTGMFKQELWRENNKILNTEAPIGLVPEIILSTYSHNLFP